VLIALGLGLSVVFGGGIGRAHERPTDGASAAIESHGDDALAALTARLLDGGLGADERRSIALARQQHLADLIARDPAEVVKRALSPTARARLAPDVQGLIEREETHEGTLQVLHADGASGEQYFYNLQKPSGERLSLHFADAAPAVLSGAPVRVHGVQVQQALALGGTSAVTLLGAPALPNTFGAQRILVIRLQFQNTVGTALQTLAQVQDVAFGAGIASATEFYREVSYQQTWLTGDIIGPLVIPLSNTGCDYTRISTLAQTAATAAGAVLTQYAHLVYVFPTAPCGWGGLGSVGGVPGEVWINGAIDSQLLSHELGHNLGLFHSHALECGTVAFGGSCTTVEYGDMFDTMGSGYLYHFNAVQKDQLGWLGYGASPPITLVASSGTYTIDPYETQGVNPKALKVQTSAGDWLYVEYRRPTGFDATMSNYPNVMSGVLVHYWTGQGNGVSLLDMTPATASWQDPALAVGGTFADAAGGVSITPVWVNGTTAGVNITMGTGCARKAPSLSVTPAQQTAGAGTALSYTVSVRNNDTGCGTSSYTLSANAPVGWAGGLTGGTMSLAAGGTGTATLQLTSPASAAPAAYAATIVAAGATLSTTASASYVVSAPSPTGSAGAFVDGFDRPDAPTLGYGWMQVSGAFAIVSGEARSAVARGLQMSVRPDVAGAAQVVAASFASVDNNTAPQLGVVLRYRDAGNYYRCYRGAGGVSVARIVKVMNGREIVLKSVAMANPAKNALFTVSCEASGSTLTLKIDGVIKLSATDTAFAAGGVGIAMNSTTGAGAAHRADNFSASAQ